MIINCDVVIGYTISEAYQTGVEFVLLGQEDLWCIRHDVKVGLILLPGRNISFLETEDEHNLVRCNLICVIINIIIEKTELCLKHIIGFNIKVGC